ncbi:MAG: helix-turn-helix transcriptional regulator [Lachnospiraceae bacterium]|nr:helix-turn-helix transcriptional regulator [Lachnospiraceae bacterium]
MRTRIKELRLEKNLTQQSLANYLGVNQATVSKLENESTTLDAMLLTRLSNFFDVSADYVLYLSEQRLSADLLLADNMHHLKKYQHLISLYQKMTPRQQKDFYNFISSLLGSDQNP